MAYHRTTEDLREAAEVQLRGMQISARAFDEGLTGEATRLAAAVFTLIGRGMRHHASIYDAAGQQDLRLYRSTLSKDTSGSQLICARLEKIGQDEWAIELKPRGREALAFGRDLPFDEWWAEIVIDNDSIKLTRSEIVRILRDKNGGCHFDVVVNDDLVAAAIKSDIGAFLYKPSERDEAEVVPGGLENCMRQIATELWFSLEENLKQADNS